VTGPQQSPLLRARVVDVRPDGVRVTVPALSTVHVSPALQRLGDEPLTAGDLVLVARVGDYRDDLVVLGRLT
jgi:hypothetical protein